MKKLALILSLSIICFTSAIAQSSIKPLQSDKTIHSAGLDTVTNAGTISQVIQVTGYQDLVTIQAGVIKLTGTTAGSLKLYGSNDGIKYDVATTTTDTLAVANVAGAQVKTWKFLPSTFQYYKLVYKSSNSSQTSTVSSSALIRKK